jgi:hypothetical protein
MENYNRSNKLKNLDNLGGGLRLTAFCQVYSKTVIKGNFHYHNEFHSGIARNALGDFFDFFTFWDIREFFWTLKLL